MPSSQVSENVAVLRRDITDPMFGPDKHIVSQSTHYSNNIRTRQQCDPSGTATQPHVIGDEVALQRRARAQRRVPQLLKVNERLVALDEVRAARRLPERARRFGEAEQTVELREHAHRAQPNAAVRVELGVQPPSELLDRRVAVLARFFELPDRLLEGWDDETFRVLEAKLETRSIVEGGEIAHFCGAAQYPVLHLLILFFAFELDEIDFLERS